MDQEPTKRAREAKALLASVCRQGPNAIVSDTIPLCWVHYFSNDDQEALSEMEGDEAWNQQHAMDWLKRWHKQGYHYSGPGAEEKESGTYNSLFGTLQQVFLVNQQVLDEDQRKCRFSVSGTDNLPSEYVLDKFFEAVVELPENFEPRLQDPRVDVGESRGPETPAPATSPEQVGDCGPVDEDALREASDPWNWTNEACDFAILYLATRGWKMGPALPGTDKDGWFAGHWGPTMYYLVRKVLPDTPEMNHVVHRDWAIKPTLITANGPVPA